MCVTIYHGGATGFEERDTLLELLREIDSDRFQVISTFFTIGKGTSDSDFYL